MCGDASRWLCVSWAMCANCGMYGIVNSSIIIIIIIPRRRANSLWGAPRAGRGSHSPSVASAACVRVLPPRACLGASPLAHFNSFNSIHCTALVETANIAQPRQEQCNHRIHSTSIVSLPPRYASPPPSVPVEATVKSETGLTPTCARMARMPPG